MADIKVQKIPRAESRLPRRKVFATVAYHFPQYTLKEVAALPYRDVQLLLKTAQQQQAAYFHNMTLIVQAPHSKKQQNVKKLVDHFKKLAGL